MSKFTPLVRSALLTVMMTACAAGSITLNDVAGKYGCGPCFLSGSTLLLRPDGTYSLCMFSDQPDFNGKYSTELEGTYGLDGQRVDLDGEAPAHWDYRYVLRTRGKVFMVREDTFLKYRDDKDVIEKIGRQRRSAPANSPFVCD